MRFLELFFFVTSSWQIRNLKPEQIINATSSKWLEKSLDFSFEVDSSDQTSSRATQRFDYDLDRAAVLLCAEFYKKNYG